MMKRKAQRGGILPLVLIILAILTIMAMMLSKQVKMQLQDVYLLSEQWESELAIHNATQRIILELLTKEIGAKEIIRDDINWSIGGEQIVVDGVAVKIQDVAGLMSLGYYNQDSFQRLAQTLMPAAVASKLAAEIGDWIDEDNFTRYQGMEAVDYKLAGYTTRPRNGHLKSMDELLLLPSMTAEIYNGNIDKQLPALRDLIVIGGMGWFNVASAPEILIKPYLNINEKSVKKLILARQNSDWQQFDKEIYKSNLFFELPPNTPGIEFRIISKKNEWGARMTVRISPFKDTPYEIIQWQYPDYRRE